MSVAAVIHELWWAGANEPSDQHGAVGRGRVRDTTPRTHDRDEPLVARLRDGDSTAFDEIVRETFPLLSRVAARLTGSIADGEEAAQDVLFRLWMRRETFHLSTTLTVYLLTAVRNRALNVIRERNTAERYLPDAVSAADYGAVATDAELLDTERRRQVAHALNALVPRHRLAVELRYGACASFAEVGAALGVSDRAAEQLVRRAVAALRRLLGEAV